MPTTSTPRSAPRVVKSEKTSNLLRRQSRQSGTNAPQSSLMILAEHFLEKLAPSVSHLRQFSSQVSSGLGPLQLSSHRDVDRRTRDEGRTIGSWGTSRKHGCFTTTFGELFLTGWADRILLKTSVASLPRFPAMITSKKGDLTSCAERLGRYVCRSCGES